MPLLKIVVPTTGGAGVSAGNNTTDAAVEGTLRAIFVDFTSMPATTDITITEVGGMGRTLLTITNQNADKVYYPLVLAQGITGADLTAIYAAYHLPGVKLKATVAQGDDAAAGVIVYFDIEPDRR